MAMDVFDPAKAVWYKLARNPADWAVDFIEANLDIAQPCPYNYACNQNPRAVAYIARHIDRFDNDDWEMVSTNPSAISLLRAHPTKLDRVYLMWNPMAKPLIDELKIPIDYVALANNPAEWAVDLLLRPGVIASLDSKYGLSGNVNPRIVAHLLSHPELIEYEALSTNPTAIDHLRANPDKVTASIYANPAIFEPTILAGLIELLTTLQF